MKSLCAIAVRLLSIPLAASGPARARTTARLSVDSQGVKTNAASGRPSSTAAGRFAAFASDAENLVPVDTNGAADVFVHDRRAGETCLPTPLAGGSPAPGAIRINTGSAAADSPTLPSRPVPSTVLSRPREFGRPADVDVQGIIRDRAAPAAASRVRRDRRRRHGS